MMKVLLFVLLLAVLTILSTIQAMDTAQYHQSRTIYLAAVNSDDEDTVLEAIKYFEQLPVKVPFDSLINSYRGSLESIMATHVFLPWNKIKHTEIGSEQMDDAIEQLSEIHDTTKLMGTAISILVRLNIAQTYFEFPDFLNRYQDSKDLLADILDTAQFEQADIKVKNHVYQLAAAMAEKDGEELQQAAFLAKIQVIE